MLLRNVVAFWFFRIFEGSVCMAWSLGSSGVRCDDRFYVSSLCFCGPHYSAGALTEVWALIGLLSLKFGNNEASIDYWAA